MNRKNNDWMRAVLAAVVLLLIFQTGVYGGKAEALETHKSDASVLVIFTAESDEVSPEVRLLDMAIGHFTDDITFKSAAEVETEDTDGITHIFYYGLEEGQVSGETNEIINAFEGPIVAIGHNLEDLGRKFSFAEVEEDQTITELNILDEEKEQTIDPNTIFGTEIDEETETLVEAEGETGKYPFISVNEENYYIASDKIVPPYGVYISQILNTVFDQEPLDKTPAYLRLEDVHPLADAAGLMETAEFLKEQEIPYMIAVIPVYTNPETGREYHFNDSPEVLEALKYMQDNGGSVVLHGYTHQFRSTETGEGFEFWDVENDMPVYHGPHDEPNNKTEEEFDTREEYESYMAENKAFERNYIEERLTRGVQELANFGLYPLAFEAPHYTMSQNGYEVTSEYFSTYVGQLQLSDMHWTNMDTTPNISKPAMLHGMTLLPETIGYVQPDDEEAVEKMMARAETYQIPEGGMIGGFYHPYLGIEGLKELVGEMKTIPDIEWIDLKEMENTVAVENVSITSGGGEIQADINTPGLMTTSVDFPAYHVKNFVDKVTWGIAGVGGTAVMIFIGYTVFQRPRERLSARREK